MTKENETAAANAAAIVPDESAEPNTTADVYHVLIERSNNEIVSAEVFGFEVPVLRKLHGDSRVTFYKYDPGTEIEEVAPVMEAEIQGDASSVLAMLRSKYNSPVTGDVVSAVYRDADELASKSGIAKTKGKKRAGPKLSENTDNRKKADKK
jgi:hypothetical protein